MEIMMKLESIESDPLIYTNIPWLRSSARIPALNCLETKVFRAPYAKIQKDETESQKKTPLVNDSFSYPHLCQTSFHGGRSKKVLVTSLHILASQKKLGKKRRKIRSGKRGV